MQARFEQPQVKLTRMAESNLLKSRHGVMATREAWRRSGAGRSGLTVSRSLEPAAAAAGDCPDRGHGQQSSDDQPFKVAAAEVLKKSKIEPAHQSQRIAYCAQHLSSPSIGSFVGVVRGREVVAPLAAGAAGVCEARGKSFYLKSPKR